MSKRHTVSALVIIFLKWSLTFQQDNSEIYLLFYLFFLSVYECLLACMSVFRLCTYVPEDAPGLELPMVVSHHVGGY